MKKAFKGILWWTGVAAIGIVFGVSLQFAMAWIEPTLPPPGGNLGAPINTSSIWQSKWGGLSTVAFATQYLNIGPGAGAGKVLTSDANGWATWQEPAGTAGTACDWSGWKPDIQCAGNCIGQYTSGACTIDGYATTINCQNGNIIGVSTCCTECAPIYNAGEGTIGGEE